MLFGLFFLPSLLIHSSIPCGGFPSPSLPPCQQDQEREDWSDVVGMCTTRARVSAWVEAGWDDISEDQLFRVSSLISGKC